MTPLDEQRLADAMALAECSIGVSDPNPRVGCVIGLEDGTILGKGSTQEAGGPHAEVMALRNARGAGHDVTGATAWVTLEPCAHHGRTPPCCDALVAAGLARVVIAVEDPFHRVDGRGVARLRAAGIRVDMASDAIARTARELNVGFFSRHERGRPWVRLKAAISLDGRMALMSGASRWITGPAARTDGHAWRRRAGAVVTGVGTVLADDPRLDVREVPTQVQPLRVVLDSRARTPPTARLLAAPGRALIVTGPGADAAPLQAAGAEVVALAGSPAESAARPPIASLLGELARREVNEVHLEAGPTMNASWLEGGWVDELLVYIAPTIVGPGRPLADIADLASLADLGTGRRFQWIEVTTVGADLRLRATASGRAGDTAVGA